MSRNASNNSARTVQDRTVAEAVRQANLNVRNDISMVVTYATIVPWDGITGKPAIINTLAGLANAAGWLHNDGAGVLTYSTPTKGDVGLGAVENTALSTWAGSTAIVTLGTISTGSIPASLVTTGTFGAGAFTFQNALNVSGLFAVTVASGYAATFMGGSLGIGTVSPTLGKLVVVGSSTVPAIFIQLGNSATEIVWQSGGAGGATYGWKLFEDESVTGNLYLKGVVAGVINSSPAIAFARGTDYVGVGTLTPFSRLEVYDTSWSGVNAPYGVIFRITGKNRLDDNWGHIQITDETKSVGRGGSFTLGAGTSGGDPICGVKAIVEGVNGASVGYGGLALQTRPDNSIGQGNVILTRLYIDSLGRVGIGTVVPGYNLEVTGTVHTTGIITSAAGIGYGVGTGGAVTQLTSKSTGVTLDKLGGEITMHNATLNGHSAVTFILTNSFIKATDYVAVQHDHDGTIGHYNCFSNMETDGHTHITVESTDTGNLSEAIVLRFIVLKMALT